MKSQSPWSNIMSDFAYSFARALIPILFIVSGVGKFLNVTGIANHPALTNFMNAFGEITTRTTLGYIIAAIEVFGGISVLIGLKTRWGAIALILFTACTIIFAHNFWTMEGAARAANQIQALKNLAIMGGLLTIAIMGSGRYSLDNALAARERSFDLYERFRTNLR
jgi:putative oxidoreductase